MRQRTGKSARMTGVDFDRDAVNAVHDEAAEAEEAKLKEEVAKEATAKAEAKAAEQAKLDAKADAVQAAHADASDSDPKAE
jgi:UDP-N-acetyl-D-mannosaminuronate dehydrogenase